MQFIFLKSGNFPADYNGDPLVSFHGSWNRNPPSGYEVLRVCFTAGKPTSLEPFVEGFMKPTPKQGSGWARFARPFGLVQLPDGSVLLGDEQNGVLYRITYTAP